MLATVAEFFGISVLRLGIYAGCIALALGGAATIRQHYINKGYHSAIDAVKKQDDRAVAAADRVKKRADECSADSWWDVVSQSCKLEGAE
jgi:hypothetical protein